MSMLIAAGVRPTWLALIMGFIQPQCTSVSLWCHPAYDVTLSAAKGLSPVAHEMLRYAQHDKAVVLPLLPRVSPWLASPGVTLSAAKGLSPVAHEMLRCAQHDRMALGMTGQRSA